MSIETLVCPLPEHTLPRMAAVDARSLPRHGDDPRPAWPRSILVASDASPSSNAAITVARRLAEQSGASVEMTAVYSPRIPLPASPERQGFDQCEAPERGEAVALLRAVREQRRSMPETRTWPLHLDVGDPGSVIVRLANTAATDLVVLGIGELNPDERRYAGHTASCVARYLRMPVYAAALDCEAPMRCVVALPDGQVHAPTLRAAVACLPAGAQVWIALPSPSANGQSDGQSESARELVDSACGPELANHLDTLELARIDVVGDMLAAVLGLVRDVNAQLVAVPNRGDPGPMRGFLANLAEPLLLAVRCSVLVVPDESVAR
jgi:nucleotide-binding universal stress UspA family protein